VTHLYTTTRNSCWGIFGHSTAVTRVCRGARELQLTPARENTRQCGNYRIHWLAALLQKGLQNSLFESPQLQFHIEFEVQIWSNVGEHYILFIRENQIEKY